MPKAGEVINDGRAVSQRAQNRTAKRQDARDGASPYGYSKPRNSSSRKSPNTKHTASKRQWTEEVLPRVS